MRAEDFNKYLEEIRNGDNHSLETIYKEYYRAIKRTARNMDIVESAVEDIASECMREILEKAKEGKIQYVKVPGAWMCNLAKKRSIDYIRKNSKTVGVENIDAFNTEMDEDDYQIFDEAFKVLSEVERHLVECYFYGLKFREIADEIKMPLGTVKSHFSIIRKKLESVK